MEPFRVSNVDEWHYFATFAFCVAPGHIANNVIYLIYDEYLSIVGVPTLSQFRVSNVDEIKYIATFAFSVAPGHIENHVIILI